MFMFRYVFARVAQGVWWLQVVGGGCGWLASYWAVVSGSSGFVNPPSGGKMSQLGCFGRLELGVRRLRLGVRRLKLGVRRLNVGVRDFTFGVWQRCSVGGD